MGTQERRKQVKGKNEPQLKQVVDRRCESEVYQKKTVLKFGVHFFNVSVPLMAAMPSQPWTKLIRCLLPSSQRSSHKCMPAPITTVTGC